MATKLLNAVADNTTGTGIKMKNPVTVFADGTFGNGTVSIQVAPDNDGTAGTYVEVESFTAPGRANIFMLGVYWIRAVLSGATAPTVTVSTS